MVTQTVVNASPDELVGLFHKAMQPFFAELESLQAKVANSKHAYTVAEVAEKIGYSTKSISRFIKEGRPGRKGRVYLKAHEITTGDYRITPADLDHFIAQF